MKLYGALASPYVLRVVLFARLKEVDLPLVQTPGGSPRSPEYLAFNPIGKIPSLDVDGRCIPESEVICEYLEDMYPKKAGLPADKLERAGSRLISRIVDTYVAPQVAPFFRNMNPASRDQAAVDAAGAELKKAFGYLEQFMGAGPFCVGAQPTLGDCALAPYMVLLKKMVFANFPNVADPTQAGRLAKWWQAIQGHEVCKSLTDEYVTALESFMKAMAARGRPGPA
jgi:glutathione S-transferase